MIPSIDNMLLAPGDRMDVEEFLERWEQSPELKFAELIDGTVYMPSPLSRSHGRFDSLADLVLGYYAARSSMCEPITNATWLMHDSAPQPDLALYLKPEYGGKVEVDTRDLASGIPELIVEVCRSSRSYDLGPKLALYQHARVAEYVAVLIEEKRFEWRILTQDRYQFLQPADGVFRSRIFPGLWIEEAAFWSADRTRLLAVLDQGLNSPEFLEFKRKLKPASE